MGVEVQVPHSALGDTKGWGPCIVISRSSAPAPPRPSCPDTSLVGKCRSGAFHYYPPLAQGLSADTLTLQVKIAFLLIPTVRRESPGSLLVLLWYCPVGRGWRTKYGPSEHRALCDPTDCKLRKLALKITLSLQVAAWRGSSCKAWVTLNHRCQKHRVVDPDLGLWPCHSPTRPWHAFLNHSLHDVRHVQWAKYRGHRESGVMVLARTCLGRARAPGVWTNFWARGRDNNASVPYDPLPTSLVSWGLGGKIFVLSNNKEMCHFTISCTFEFVNWGFGEDWFYLFIYTHTHTHTRMNPPIPFVLQFIFFTKCL